jgi:Rieske Fe-S protein
MTIEPSTTDRSHAPAPARRAVLAGAGIAGAAAVLTACGSGGSSTATAPQSPAPSTAGSAGAAGAEVLGAASQVPVGGGVVFKEQQVVVTQPSSGEFKAFTAICTHMGCTVSTVSGGTINCPCHGSQYSIATGAVVRGPAPLPLAAKPISVSDGEISLT